MILIWISIATFIPSSERQTNTTRAAPKAEEDSVPVVQIRETESAAVVYDDEPELVE